MNWIGCIVIFTWSCFVFGQDTLTIVKPLDSERPGSKSIEFPDILPFDCVSDAQFPGGAIALFRYISDVADWSCLDFPEDLFTNSRVYILFTVNEHGEIEDPEIFRGIHPEIDQYCLDLAREMPKWIPAIDFEQKPIKRKMALPITICLD